MQMTVHSWRNWDPWGLFALNQESNCVLVQNQSNMLVNIINKICIYFFVLKKHSQKQVVSDDLKEWFLPELTVAWFLQSVNLKCPINTYALNLCEPLFPPPKKDNVAACLVDTFKNRGKRTMATSPSSHNRCFCKFSSKGKMKPSWTRTCWTRTTAPLERRLQWRFMDSRVHVQTATTDGPTAHRKHTGTFQRLFSAQLKHSMRIKM